MGALIVGMAGCSSTPTVPSDAETPVASQRAGEQGWFVLDQVVRSDQLAGIYLHLRAVERTADNLVVHVAFYNNRGDDLEAVHGIDLQQTRLVGARTYEPSARSASLAQGIAPPGRWISGGGNVGTFTVPNAQGDAWELRVPAFPAVRFTLDHPSAPPVRTALPVGTFQYNTEVVSTQLTNIALRVAQVAVTNDTVALTVAFTNRNAGAVTLSSASPLTGNDAVLLDGEWQQYQPRAVDPALAQNIAPAGDTWAANASNRGTITFPRPSDGDVVLFAMPGFPPLRLPLKANAAATVATVADLPPATQPRPSPSALVQQPSAASAQPQVAQLLQQINDALKERDHDTYVAAFAPDLQAAQGVVFDQLGTLPLENITWNAAANSQATLSPDGNALQNYGIELRYQIAGVDPKNPFVSTLTAQLTQTNGRWTITTLSGQQPFWLYGPTTTRRSGAFLIFARPGMDAELPAIEREAQQALEQVGRALPGRAQATNVMFVTGTDDEFSALTGRNGTQFVGVATARFEMNADTLDVTNRAFFLNGAAFRSDSTQQRQRTITHELTHLVLASSTMPYTPAWLSEGAAMVVSNDLPAATLRRVQQTGGLDTLSIAALSSQTSFGGAAGATVDETSADYAYSAFLAKYLIDTYGADRFWALYDWFARVPVRDVRAALSGANNDFDTAMHTLAPTMTATNVQATYGVDLQTLDRNYKTWLIQRLNDKR